MLTNLRLENFRGFDKYDIPLRNVTVIVGQNNAGKSTIVEALRLLSVVVHRYRNLSYNNPPSWSDLPKRYIGVAPSLKNMEINFLSFFHNYNDPPAIISAFFSDKSSVVIYLYAEDKIHAVIRDQNGKEISSRDQAYQVDLPTVNIMPQVAPVNPQEVVLTDNYVKGAISSSLAPLHFRNQLRVFYNLFPEFQEIVEETWPSVQIKELIGRERLPGRQLSLHVRNEGFVAEVAAMGHGLQMWLQTMWFLTLSKRASTVILDEPDVYMHPDLQRRIIRFLKNRHRQIILTTHSVEIMSEVQPDEILIVDKKRTKSMFASSLPAVQKIIENVGSVHNIHLAKLWNARRFILVEGKDLKILKQFQNTLFPNTQEPFDSIPHMSIMGWGGWNYAVGSSMFLKNALGEKIITYCVMDSDYHTNKEIIERKSEATTRGVQLHIWAQKEIENYLIDPTVIHRVISKRIARRTKGPTVAEIQSKIKDISDTMEETVFDAVSTEIRKYKHSLGQGGANKEARKILKMKKQDENGLLSLVSGKELLSLLLQWSQAEFGVAFSLITIAKEMASHEIPEEVSKVISTIENEETFVYDDK